VAARYAERPAVDVGEKAWANFGGDPVVGTVESLVEFEHWWEVTLVLDRPPLDAVGE